MLYTKIQPQTFLGSWEKGFLSVLTYMGMSVSLFKSAKPFKQTVNILLTEGPMWNLVKIAQAISENKTFKKYRILYNYIDQSQGQITLRGQNFVCY